MIILQEIHFIKKNMKTNTILVVDAFHAYSDSVHFKGVTDLFKTILDRRILSINKFADGRTILLNIELNDGSYYPW